MDTPEIGGIMKDAVAVALVVERGAESTVEVSGLLEVLGEQDDRRDPGHSPMLAHAFAASTISE